MVQNNKAKRIEGAFWRVYVVPTHQATGVMTRVDIITQGE